MDLKTILLLLCSIILCSCKPPLASFFPQRDNGMEKSLAKENHLSAEDVYADVCSQKANYVNVEFKKLPPDGIFKLNRSIRYGCGPKPRFIHFKVIGGDITNLLADPDCVSITKTGNIPILCQKLPADTGDRYSWNLKNFTPEDLSAIAPNLPAERKRWIIDLEPADGIVDWQVIARFPAKIGWRFRNVKRWLHADTAKVTSDFWVFYDGYIELPAQFSIRRIYLDKEAILPEKSRKMLLDQAKSHTLPKEFLDSEMFEF